MKLTILQQLVRHIATYHFLSCFVVFLVVEVEAASVKSELRTKQLLQNIRSHLAQQVDEIVQQKECDTGLTLCEPSKSKEVEGEEDEDDEDIPPPPKIRGHHKPVIKVNPKDVIQTMIHKVHKPPPKKADKEPEPEKEKDVKSKKIKKVTDEDEEEDEDGEEEDDDEEEAEKKKTKKKAKSVVKVSKPKAKKKEEKSAGIEFPKEVPVFAPTTNIVKTALCRKHSRVYLRQLKRYKMWALMMYDASAKLPSGILQGNINQYGDFDECLSINAIFKNPKSKKPPEESSGIQGKYCLASIDVSAGVADDGLRQAIYRSQSFAFVRSTAENPGHFIPRFSTVNWGLCVPSACPAKDVERSLELDLSHYNETSGLLFNVKVDKDNCVTKEDTMFSLSFMTFLTILFYLSVVGTAGYATYKDLYVENPDISEMKEEKEEEGKEEDKSKDNSVEDKEAEDKPEKVESDGEAVTEEAEKPEEVIKPKRSFFKEKLRRIMSAFSLKRNVEKLLQDCKSEEDIACIHGIKSIFTIMLYFAHKTIPLALTPFNNRILLTQISNEATSVLLRASIIYTDSFLLISGVLTSYNLSKEISEKGKIPWVKRSIARFIRLTPALLAVVLFYAYVADHLGSGPIWNVVVKKNAEICQRNMWKNLFYIQNFFAFEDMCAAQTHQLALDMQLSLLAPLFVYLLHKYDKIGFGILQAIFLLSSIMRYISTSNNNLSLIIFHGMPVSQLYRTANMLYSQALHRASPYILGVMIGYYLKKFGKQLDFPKPAIAIGWITALCFGFLSIVTPSHLADRNYQYDVDEAAQYAALSPIAWSMALGWVIIACHLGYGGKLNEVLCHKVNLVFSRITYAVYLTQFLVFFYRVGVKRIPETFSLSGSFNISEFLTVVIISIVVTLLFDLPMMEIKSIVFEKEPIDDQPSEESEEIKAEGEDTTEQVEEIPDNLNPEEELNPEELEAEEIDYPPEEEEEEIEDLEELDEYDEEEGDQQPLRRSTRIQFDDELEDKEFWENENRELEAQKAQKAPKVEEEIEDFWGQDED